MPVTQRWVHSGLILVAGILSVSLTVLILGASRPTVSDSGLVGSPAPVFALKDNAGKWVNLRDCRQKVMVLIIAPAQSAALGRQGKQVGQLVDTFAKDQDVQFLGVEFDPSVGLLGQSKAVGAIETALPGVQAVRDVDNSVALAYRVGTTPVLFVIDPAGVIRARLPLDTDGATVAASETITSLRQPEITMPILPTDTRSY